ncbi:MAG: hypothetical protein CMC96_14860 [Flavobacteriales bacterium]|nr:hypothetical protein [Flavobacteriales bacterium]
MILYIVAYFSDFFYVVERLFDFHDTSIIKGKDALLGGWIVSKKAFVPWVSNLIFFFLILYKKPIPLLKTILSILMVWLGFHIFKLKGYTEFKWKDTIYISLYPRNGIYIWLISYFSLAIYIVIEEVKFIKRKLFHNIPKQ